MKPAVEPVAPAPEPTGPFRWFQGRAGRREYWTQIAFLFVVSYLMAGASPILKLVLTVILMLIQIRRVHDLGRSAWWAVAATVAPILLIVPVLRVASLDVATITGVVFELILLLVIGVPPGDPDDNRFGPPPPYTLRRVLTGR
jgi:uncharacterized membrane protein YhaH (DUF805 family)